MKGLYHGHYPLTSAFSSAGLAGCAAVEHDEPQKYRRSPGQSPSGVVGDAETALRRNPQRFRRAAPRHGRQPEPPALRAQRHGADLCAAYGHAAAKRAEGHRRGTEP